MSGLQYSWLSKFSSGERGTNPSFEHITRLQTALDAMEAAETVEPTPSSN